MAYTMSKEFGRNVALAAIGTAVCVVGGAGLAPVAAAAAATVYGYEVLDHASKQAKSRRSRGRARNRRCGPCRRSRR